MFGVWTEGYQTVLKIVEWYPCIRHCTSCSQPWAHTAMHFDGPTKFDDLTYANELVTNSTTRSDKLAGDVDGYSCWSGYTMCRKCKWSHCVCKLYHDISENTQLVILRLTDSKTPPCTVWMMNQPRFRSKISELLYDCWDVFVPLLDLFSDGRVVQRWLEAASVSNIVTRGRGQHQQRRAHLYHVLRWFDQNMYRVDQRATITSLGDCTCPDLSIHSVQYSMRRCRSHPSNKLETCGHPLCYKTIEKWVADLYGNHVVRVVRATGMERWDHCLSIQF